MKIVLVLEKLYQTLESLYGDIGAEDEGSPERENLWQPIFSAFVKVIDEAEEGSPARQWAINSRGWLSLSANRDDLGQWLSPEKAQKRLWEIDEQATKAEFKSRMKKLEDDHPKTLEEAEKRRQSALCG